MPNRLNYFSIHNDNMKTNFAVTKLTFIKRCYKLGGFSFNVMRSNVIQFLEVANIIKETYKDNLLGIVFFCK